MSIPTMSVNTVKLALNVTRSDATIASIKKLLNLQENLSELITKFKQKANWPKYDVLTQWLHEWTEKI